MTRYLLRRVLQAVLVLLGVSIATFAVGHLTGDPVDLIARENASREAKQALRIDLGLDRPIVVQYLAFAGRALQGDLGFSFVQRTKVSSLVAERFPATLELGIVAFVIAVVIAVPLGVTTALRRGSLVDFGVTILSMLGLAAPGFWIGLMLVVVFAVELKWLPVSGYGDGLSFILPAVTLALPSAARLTRLMRASVLDVISSDYVRTARAKGLRAPEVLTMHVLRNALIPVVTMAGLELAELLSGAFITETIFAWPGVGRLAVEAVYQRDFPVVQGVVLAAATLFVAINLAVDLLYGLIDPRVKLG